jgi:hypothetical protein
MKEIKYTPVLPLTDEKIGAYLQGDLTISRKLRYGKHQFVYSARSRGLPGKTVDSKKAYFRIWYGRKHYGHIPGFINALDEYRVKTYGFASVGEGIGKGRGGRSVKPPEVVASPAKAVKVVATEATAAMPVVPKARRKTRKAILAYKRGYNAAYRSQMSRINALTEALNKATAKLDKQEDGVAVVPETRGSRVVPVKATKRSFLDRLTSALAGF